MATRRNLHSHVQQAPLSNGQEVSAFGNDGEGDAADDWVVEIDGTGKNWNREDEVYLKHEGTGKYLMMTKNTFRNPIPGQREVACGPKNIYAKWRIAEGVFFPHHEE